MRIDSGTAWIALGNTGQCRYYKMTMPHLQVSKPVHSLLWPSIRASAPALRASIRAPFAPALQAAALPAPALQVNMEEATITLRLITL